MDKLEMLLHDLKAILETVNEVHKVSHSKPVPLDAEDTFTSVYIAPTADSFDLQSAGSSAKSYDNSVFIRILVNMDCTEDELSWVRTRRKIIDAVLNDSPIWNTVIDRDIVSAMYDDYGSYPRKAMELLFEFRLREDC